CRCRDGEALVDCFEDKASVETPGEGAEVARQMFGGDHSVGGEQAVLDIGEHSVCPAEGRVACGDWSIYRDPAVLLIDQLKQVYIDGELEIVDTAQYFPKIQRKDFTVALNFQTAGPDPDPIVHLFYGCGSGLNWDGYCDAEIDKMIEQ